VQCGSKVIYLSSFYEASLKKILLSEDKHYTFDKIQKHMSPSRISQKVKMIIVILIDNNLFDMNIFSNTGSSRSSRHAISCESLSMISLSTHCALQKCNSKECEWIIARFILDCFFTTDRLVRERVIILGCCKFYDEIIIIEFHKYPLTCRCCCRHDVIQHQRLKPEFMKKNPSEKKAHMKW
jgi:hypothetical protein